MFFMAIHWSKILGSSSDMERLRALFPDVAVWDEQAISTYVPKAWKKIATLSVGLPTSQEHERTQFATIHHFGFLLFYRSQGQEFGPIAADFPSSILGCHPGWQDCDKVGIMHIEELGWDLDVDILDAIRDVTPPWNYFSLNGDFLELDLDGEIKPYDPDSASEY
jgi:hypothetical protein